MQEETKTARIRGMDTIISSIFPLPIFYLKTCGENCIGTSF